jgi:hypothetical protein
MGDTFPETDETPAKPWHGAIAWTGLLAAGLILYEFTNQPAVGMAALCFKFGWQDFRTARWLRRFDRNSARGSACWWLYVAWGLWKIGIVAFLVNALIIGGIPFLIMLPVIRNRPGPPPQLTQSMLGAGLMLLTGMGLSALATVWSMVRASRNDLKLWLHGSVRSARKHAYWPPYEDERMQGNMIGVLQLTGFLSLLVIVLPLAGYLMHLVGIGGNFGWAPGCILIGVWPAGWIWTRMSHRVTARSPAECWPPDDIAASPDDPLQ